MSKFEEELEKYNENKKQYRPLLLDDWLIEIEKEFENQTPEQFINLIEKAERECSDNEKVIGIVAVIKYKNYITFNQWKALRISLRENKKYNPIKKIN